jgi:hypothetical protein
MTKYSIEERRELIDSAKAGGLTVIGQDGSRHRGTVCGARNDFASVHVKMPAGDFSIEFGWGTIARAVAGSREVRA